jgi:EAL domain-containing protein (putative c-di-GMP-specific phosphodiesterase class I)
MRTELELATAASALELLDDDALPRDVAVTINLGPDTVTAGLADLLGGRDLSRVVVEVTEHAVVADYALLARALRPLRDQGLRLAVDDAGAGYASLRHVLDLDPDLVKVDMALVRGADDDLARRALLSGLARFADAVGCRLVAEGVETPGELQAVVGCGVGLVQGYLLSPPAAAPSWSGYDAL